MYIYIYMYIKEGERLARVGEGGRERGGKREGERDLGRSHRARTRGRAGGKGSLRRESKTLDVGEGRGSDHARVPTLAYTIAY